MMPITLPVTVRLAKPINTARHTKMLHIMPFANSVRSWPKESTKQYGSSQKKDLVWLVRGDEVYEAVWFIAEERDP